MAASLVLQDHDDDKHPEGSQQQDNTDAGSIEDVRGYGLANPIGVSSESSAGETSRSSLRRRRRGMGDAEGLRQLGG